MDTLILTAKENKARFTHYDRIDKMQKLKDQKFPHFAGPDGERSFNEYIDDSERILNGYTFSRESQDKESWQSNMLDNTARAKLRATISGIGLKVPEMAYSAMHNETGVRSVVRAELFKNITKQSFIAGNPTLSNFLEAWMMSSHGGVVVYEGYQTGGAMQKRVKSFDSRTGAFDVETVYVEGQGKPFNAILNPQEFLFWDIFIRDVQDQPRVATQQHYNKMQLEREFSKYPNYKHIYDKRTVSKFDTLAKSLYFNKWSSMVEADDDYLVTKEYDKEEDRYEIWCNGVPLLIAPLLWGDTEKYYPFAKEITEPFANPNFFWGMSLPGILEAYQDTKNTVINTMVDKLYRSMDPAWLIGLGNKDLLDAQEEFEGSDGRYYVPDVAAVKPIPIQGINQGELAMLQVLDRGIENLSIDARQQGINSAGEQPTARAAIIADEHARELKGMLYMFLENLWLQKYRLRHRNILTHYLKDKAAQKSVKDSIITVPDFCFYNGERGTLDIHVAKNKAALLSEAEIEARELAAEDQGEVYKLISILPSYMDDWYFDYQIVPMSFHNQDRLRQEDEFNSEVEWLAAFNPAVLVANIDDYTEEKLSFRGKSMSDMEQPAPAPEAMGAIPPQDTPADSPPAQPPLATSILGLE